jgi:hypothetical protein
MTCLLNSFGCFVNLDGILKLLNKNDSLTESSKKRTKKFFFYPYFIYIYFFKYYYNLLVHSDWEDTISQSRSKNLDKQENKGNWLELYKINISSNGNIAIIAYNNAFVICHGKWDFNNQIKYTMTSQIEISDQDK